MAVERVNGRHKARTAIAAPPASLDVTGERLANEGQRAVLVAEGGQASAISLIVIRVRLRCYIMNF